MQKYRYKIWGISLLEVMLAVIVMSIIVLSAARYYTITREGAKVAQAAYMINNIADASFKWVKGQPNFSALASGTYGLDNLTTTATGVGLIPNNYSGTKANPWQGYISLSSTSLDITITLSNVPQSSCVALKQKMTGMGITVTASTTCSNTGTNNFAVNFTEN